MKYIIKPTTELTPTELQRIFQIQSESYRQRGELLEQWKEKLIRSYHEWKKYIELYSHSENDHIDGYAIHTEPISFEGNYWRKIIEVGMGKHLDKERIPAFIQMINVLTVQETSYNEKQICSIVEIWEKDRHVLALTERCNLFPLRNSNFAKGLIKKILGDAQFSIEKDEKGVFCKRITSHDLNQLRKNYLFSNYGK